ncbi:hypothetical protein EZV62_022486 [Acer yangbiense]|uniref:HAT C-terminal dimerisation domain-containing protein n=1 Tax=Acer yangbiense TaxID=1000413 RepID=A0A5C7H8H8_9ROSI|nr:hypothetical protein EZV62_022486 [Acer yangbiense]
MLEHLKTCPRNVYGDVGEMLFSPRQPSGKLRSPKFDPETFRDLLIQAIIKHDLPFNFVEYEGIRTMFEFICSDIKLPCRNTAKTCVVRMFNHEKLELQNLLNLVPGRICLTSDLWTSIATDGYLTLTAHFVDNDWRLHKKILNFCPNKSFVDILRNQLNFRGALLMSDSLELHGVHETLFSLLNVYMEALSPILNLSHSKQETFGPTSSEDVIFEDFDICYKKGSVSMKTEIHKYFDDERLDRKKELDVLTWWKGQQTRYPILSHLARDVLTIPISTVASESAFSIRGRVLDQYCSSLSPDTVQALVCTRDWLFDKKTEEDHINMDELIEVVFNLNIETAINSTQGTESIMHN